jgi:YD repeat-containing protein
LTSVTSPLGHFTREDFDAVAQELRSIDANNEARFNQYDLDGRLIVSTDALGNKTLQSSDNNGNLRTYSDASSIVTTFSFWCRCLGYGNIVSVAPYHRAASESPAILERFSEESENPHGWRPVCR